MAEIEIGLGKSGRKAYSLDEIAIVPSRRTRDSADVDISWEIDAYRLELPILAASPDSIVSPAMAIEIGRLGGCGVLNLEGLWTRCEDPNSVLDEIATLSDDKATLRMRELLDEPIKATLIRDRIREIKQSGVTTAASLSPANAQQFTKELDELDMLIIKGSVVSAEHVSRTNEAFDTKQFIREFSLPVIVGNCASYQAALHIMRAGAVGVLIGVCTDDGSLGVGVPQATAIADARGARMRHLDETGVYCHVIADGGMNSAGDIAKAIVCGADAVMAGSPLMEELLLHPSAHDNGPGELFGALRTSMAITGYESLKDFQKAEVVVTNKTGDHV